MDLGGLGWPSWAWLTILVALLAELEHDEPSSRPQEAALLRAELPATLEGATSALRKHQDLSTTMELNLQKVQLVLQAGESLRRQGNRYGDRAAEAAERLRDKWVLGPRPQSPRTRPQSPGHAPNPQDTPPAPGHAPSPRAPPRGRWRRWTRWCLLTAVNHPVPQFPPVLITSEGGG